MANPAGKNVDVGYKRPPVHSRFRKGKSGNPSGRPKSQNIGNGLAALINRPVTVTLEGAAHKVPLTEALAMSLAQRALTGNTAAAREFMKIVERVTAEQKIADEKPARAEKIVISWVDPLDCNTSLQKLGVVERIDDKWRIPTWVVEAALARNRPVEINESDRQLLANSMVDREALPALLQPVDS
jgi:hypothetical protein